MTVTSEQIEIYAAGNHQKIELEHAVALADNPEGKWVILAKIPGTDTAEYVGICKDKEYVEHVVTIVDRTVAHLLKATT